MKYIDTEKLKELIEAKYKEYVDMSKQTYAALQYQYIADGLDIAEQLIDSLQQEQTECMASQGETAEVGYWNQRGLSLLLDKSLEKLGYKKGDKVIIQIRKK